MKYVSPQEYKELTGTKVSTIELRRQVKEGILKGVITEGNRYLIEYEEIDSHEVNKLRDEITKLKTIIANMIAIGNGANDETTSTDYQSIRNIRF